MARIEPPDPKQVQWNEIVLSWRRIAGQAEITPQFAHDLEAEFAPALHAMGERMVLRMQSRILADKIAVDSQTIPFRKEVRPKREFVNIPAQYDRCLPHLAGAVVCATLAAISANVLVGVAAVSFVVLTALTLYTEKARIFEFDPEPVTVAGEVKIDANYYMTFPSNTRVYPKELGGPVRMVELGEPDIRYFDGSR
jgi:hypothetical protein